MATSKISLDEGTTTNTATNTITEDEVTKHLPRSVLNTSAGVETGTAASPIEVSLANTAANATAILVDGSDVTQPISGTITANAGTGTFSANVTVLNPTSTVTANAGTGTFTAHITSWPGIVGTVADNATTPGAPVMVGGKAVAVDGTDPTAVSEDDVAILRTDLNRRLLVSDIHPGFGTFTATYTAAMTDAELVAAPGEGLSLHVTDIVISNGATAGSVVIEEDTASAKTAKVQSLFLAINGGASISLKTPIRLTANKNLGITSATVTTHSVLVNYFIAP